MSLSSGTRLGPYEIVARLGAGGMGEVYRATDTRLDRAVALKVSKSEFSERFEREARAIAALNHPHICQLYDVGPNYLVMEYVEGEVLRGPLPIAKAIQYGLQILEALDAAHRKGITHRDLKPENILVTKRGVKLLDFGLAKQSGIGLRETDATLTQALTSQGQIVGTLHYMSPEQLQGHPVDVRSDIFSFGLVLYELIAGRRAFDAASGASLIASVLKDQPPPIRQLRPDTPPAIERIICKCLEKDPDDRWQSARDLRQELIWADQEVAPPAVPQRHFPWMWLASIPLAFGLGFFIARWTSPGHAESLETSPLTTLAGVEATPALSPDGKLVAFTWTGPDYGAPKICVKQLDGSEPLVLSHGNAAHGSPAWSPDGRQIAFLRNTDKTVEILVVPALGGPERRIGEADAYLDRGMCWLPLTNRLILATAGLTSISIDTGQKMQLTNPQSGKYDSVPALSPDGRSLAFVRSIAIAGAPSEILYFALDGREQPQGAEKPITSALQAIGGIAWAPGGRSLIVSALSKGSNHLFRVHFPGGKIEPLGGISTGADLGGAISISASARKMAIAVTENDTDIWRVAGPAWPGPEHRPDPQRFIASTRDEVSPDYSPDGKRIVFESRRTGTQEIWSVDAEGHDPLQLTNFGGAPVGSPRWSPDGTKIAFDSRKFGKGDIFIVSANGGAVARVTSDSFNNNLPAWSSDGRSIFYGSERSGRWEIWKVAAEGGIPSQMTRTGAMAPQRSGGDHSLYYWGNGSIWRIPESGGSPEKVMDYQSPSFWAPSKEGVAVFAYSFGVGWLRFSDHKGVLLQQLPRPESPRFLRRPTMAVSPDGRWILLTLTALDRGDLMLVDNIR